MKLENYCFIKHKLKKNYKPKNHDITMFTAITSFEARQSKLHLQSANKHRRDVYINTFELIEGDNPIVFG